MQVVVIAHNIRSTHNVGSIFRTCDGFGIEKLILSGYTPYPALPDDQRLPHIRQKITAQIKKTALGAESSVTFEYVEAVADAIESLKTRGYSIVALEQTPGSVLLPEFASHPQKLALILGEEVHGITPDLLDVCDITLEIPMAGQKESFNVSVATGIALYELRRGYFSTTHSAP